MNFASIQTFDSQHRFSKFDFSTSRVIEFWNYFNMSYGNEQIKEEGNTNKMWVGFELEVLVQTHDF
jgi:hypothetical protein